MVKWLHRIKPSDKASDFRVTRHGKFRPSRSNGASARTGSSLSSWKRGSRPKKTKNESSSSSRGVSARQPILKRQRAWGMNLAGWSLGADASSQNLGRNAATRAQQAG